MQRKANEPFLNKQDECNENRLLELPRFYPAAKNPVRERSKTTWTKFSTFSTPPSPWWTVLPNRAY